MGQRILPRGGRPVPARRGPLRREPGRSGRAARDVRPLAVRARPHRRRSTRRPSRPSRARRSSPPRTSTSGPSRRRRSPVSTSEWCARSSRATSSASSATSSPSSSPRTAHAASTLPSSCSSTTSRCPPSSTPKRPSPATCSSSRSPGRTSARAIRVEAPDEALFEGCDVVVSGRLVSQRLAACPLEARGCVADARRRRAADPVALDADAAPRPPRARALPRSRATTRCASSLRTWAAASGQRGSRVETIIVPWLARTTGRPVRWTETRSENMVAMQHGRASRARVHDRREPRRRRAGLPPPGRAGRRRLPAVSARSFRASRR